MSIPVLIVDDDPGVIFLHELMVEESGFSDEISSFNNAESALIHLEEEPSNCSECLIFLDINMPGMNGWDFLNKLESISSQKFIHVVMVTSSVNRSDREKSKTFTHVVDFIEKPLSLETCNTLKHNKHLKHIFPGSTQSSQ